VGRVRRFADRRVYDEWGGPGASQMGAFMTIGGPRCFGDRRRYDAWVWSDAGLYGIVAMIPEFPVFEPIWHMYLHYPSNPGGPFDD